MERQNHRHTPTHTGVINVRDYAWHVQSGSGDVINIFQQETDVWIPHTHTHTYKHECSHIQPQTHRHTQTHTHLLSGKQS